MDTIKLAETTRATVMKPAERSFLKRVPISLYQYSTSAIENTEMWDIEVVVLVVYGFWVNTATRERFGMDQDRLAVDKSINNLHLGTITGGRCGTKGVHNL